MCGIVDKVFDMVDTVISGPDKPQSAPVAAAASAPAPAVVRSDPVADDAKVQADAAAKAASERTTTTRRRKYSSLLATGGGGDVSAVSTMAPAAQAGKQTLGA